jgi:hypothetical protein
LQREPAEAAPLSAGSPRHSIDETTYGFIVVTLIVLVFVETQAPGTSFPAVLARAAQEVLGARAQVSTRPMPVGATDDTLVSVGREEGASAVARVVWRDADALSAGVEITLVADGRRTTQRLIFEGHDPPQERWRALGLILASALTKDLQNRGADSIRDSSADLAAEPRSAAASSSGRPHWALDAAFANGFAIGGAGGGSGGTVGLRWLPLPRLGFRLGMLGRFDDMDEAEATILTVAGTAGVIFELPRLRWERVTFAVRLDALFLYQAMTRASAATPAPAEKSRLMPAASLLAEMRWSLSPTLAVVLAAGPEVAAGATHVFVEDREVGQLPPLRAVVQAGLVAGF